MAQVLVVDDAATVRQQLVLALLPLDIEVATAEHGARALEILEADPDVRLVLSDLRMPVMDGFELMARIDRERGGRPKVLVYTCESSRTLLARARELGAVGWITKPAGAGAIAEAVARFL